MLTKRDLAPYRPRQANGLEDLQKTQPIAVPAAPGYGYLLLDTVGAGSVLSSYLVMVRTVDFNSGNLEADEKVVFKLGRGPSCQLLVN